MLYETNEWYTFIKQTKLIGGYSMTDRKRKCITVILMVVLGTCMHFVIELLPAGPIAVFLGNIFPVNETSWEHMKMIWYPFLTAGIILAFQEKDKGYFAAFVVCAVMAMLMQLGAFSTYQSFTGISVLILDIIIYFVTMTFCIILAFDFAKREWAQKAFPLWVILALIITSIIIYLTYYPGGGYVFLDNEGFMGN